MINLIDQHIKDQEITLGNDSDLKHKLSGVTMENCTLNFKVSGNGVIMGRSKFYNCTFNFKVKMRYQFYNTYFEGCTFTGKMFSSEFGRREQVGSEAVKVTADVVNCDFSKLTLADGIRFLNCDMAATKLPPFPHFTVLNPYENSNFLQNSDAPEKLKKYFNFNGGLDWLMPEDKALIFDARQIAPKYDISLDDLQALLKDFEFIKM